MGAHLTKRWCSDVSDTGICHYQDEDYSCSCDEGEEHDPKRDEMMDVGKQVPEVFCKEDAVSLYSSSKTPPPKKSLRLRCEHQTVTVFKFQT